MPGTLLDWLDSAVEKHRNAAVICYSALFLTVCALLSASKMMSFDEMATYYPAKLPSTSDVIAFFLDGIDVHTPVASLILRANIALFGDGPVANRMPVAFGYLVMSVAYLFLSLADVRLCMQSRP